MCVFVLWPRRPLLVLFFFFNDTATTEIYTLSLHDALPISSWADLVRPEFKGTITMPHPASSGTGYLMVAAWLQIMGEEKGWAYMDGLHQNMGVYTHSGSKPCRQAGAGAFPVGLSLEDRASNTKKDDPPVA